MLWSSGPAGAEIDLHLVREGRPVSVRVKSANRVDFLKKPRLH